MNTQEIKLWSGDCEELRQEKAEYPHRSKYLTFIARVRDLDERDEVIKNIRLSVKNKVRGRICKPDSGFASWGFLLEELGPTGYEFYLTDPTDFWTVFDCLQQLPQIVDIEPVGSWWRNSGLNFLSLSKLRRKQFKTCNADWIARQQLQQECSKQLAAIKAADCSQFCIELSDPVDLTDCLPQMTEVEVELFMLYGAPTKGNFLGFLHEPPVIMPSADVMRYIGKVVNGKLRLPIPREQTWDLDGDLFLTWGHGYDLACMYQDSKGRKYARTRVNISTGHAQSREEKTWYMGQYYVFYREKKSS